MASETALITAEDSRSAQAEVSDMTPRASMETLSERFKSSTQSHKGSLNSCSCSSGSSYQTSKLSGSSRSYSSTIRHGQEPHKLFNQRVEKLCQILWPPQKSIKYRLSNSHVVSRLRANRYFRPFVPARQTPLVERLRGGDYNRIVGITLPSSYGIENREMILRVPRGDDGTAPDRAVAILDYVRKHTSLPIPTVVASDFTSNNFLEKPYVIQKRVPGTDLNRIWGELSHSQRCTVAHELGGVMRTLLSLESPVTGILVPTPETADNNESSTIIPFEFKHWGSEGLVVQSAASTDTPQKSQTTLEFFQTHFEYWRAIAVAELQDYSTGTDVKLFDGMLKATREMDELGLFRANLHCLCHVDIHSGNVMAEVQPDDTLKVTAILDWDEAVFAPKFVACEPLGWLWGYIVDDHVDEDEHLTWPYELAGANDVPSTPEQQELKRIFDEQAGPEYSRLAYDEISRLCRGLFRIAVEGLNASHYYKAAERILREWEVLRQSLTQETPVI